MYTIVLKALHLSSLRMYTGVLSLIHTIAQVSEASEDLNMSFVVDEEHADVLVKASDDGC